ncbi:peptidoglycan-binding protein [Sedimentibacter sp. zth1]|uniref:M14 family metallopeptidase n=1 Tax=Sedimentibacter sp. zth1 TaxID=2816908 RepID=UPI001A938DFD|nr:M14 family metallopeptidase [Sedimentibacter sp. zth1]QSX06428.1 peptidoglycan-binding protein [Sedimentibacter sp. zth1]
MILFLQNGTTGTDVMQIQSLLKKLKLYNGDVDGVYGPITSKAIKKFQMLNGIKEDGIVGPVTEKALEKYFLGFTFYTVEPNDTIETIAALNNSTESLIKSANPTVDFENLIPNTAITIPFNYEIVPDDVKYTYDIMEMNIMGLKQRYPFLDVSSIGKSVLDKELYMIKFGVGPKKLHFNSTHHALEWINSVFLMQLIERMSNALINNETIEGYDLQDIYNNFTMYIVPMVNPDGVDLVNEGLKLDNPYYNDLLKWNNTGKSFGEVWQSNIRGVDLNHNYDAGWEASKKAENKIGITGPGPTRYSGPSAFSEPETIALRDLTKEEDFYLVIAYHSQGEIIYWNFMNLSTEKDEEIGEKLAEASGYVLDTAKGVASYAGYKDWFIQDFQNPGYTVETGKGKNPLPLSQLPKIYDDNVKLILASTTV